jgi:formylglycine-generating enzyme required for sulfatase activity
VVERALASLIRLVQGRDALSLAVQYAFLVLVSLWVLKRIIKDRIGSLNAVLITSYPRFVLGMVAVNMACLLPYHLLLLIKPFSSLLRLLAWLAASVVSYPFIALIVGPFGWVFDRGRAIQVITFRYKRRERAGFQDLTEEHGKNANLMLRAAAMSYILLTGLCLCAAIIAATGRSGLVTEVPRKEIPVARHDRSSGPIRYGGIIFNALIVGVVGYKYVLLPLARRRRRNALGPGSIEWQGPCGEPVWITVRAGEFWMGRDAAEEESYGAIEDRDASPMHRVFIEEFQIARGPVTNAQYALFISATGEDPPRHWNRGIFNAKRANDPVTYVSWHAARRYCEWLSSVTRSGIRLPTEPQWEKAARGCLDSRQFPWGNIFDRKRANTKEAGLGAVSPVGAYPLGASPYGCLDMCGNVYEFTASLWGHDQQEAQYRYPYDSRDGREDLSQPDVVCRAVRGGSFALGKRYARCTSRFGISPKRGFFDIGFRVVRT